VYTPAHLAEKILTARSALEGERKQVTVLFADVKGSMELAEQMDPEAWSEIMQRFVRILVDGVERFEGFGDKFTGDGIMALFGAPIAHEDHAQRACWAALHLRDALKRYADELRRTAGVSLSVRIGLNSGDVVVGTIGDDLRMDYTAQGHTVGLAQRMEQRAAADSAYVTEHTARLVQGYFALRDLGAFDLKGVSAPVTVYELTGVGALRSRLDRSRARGFSRFVGRADEQAVLETALNRSLSSSRRSSTPWSSRAASSGNFRSLEPEVLSDLSLAHCALGALPEARAVAERALNLAGERGLLRLEVMALRALACIHLEEGTVASLAEARRLLDRAESRAEAIGFRLIRPRLYELRAALARRQGDAVAAQAALREAQRLYREMGATRQVERLGQELGE
jgi:class 3 adenylate cyclase